MVDRLYQVKKPVDHKNPHVTDKPTIYYGSKEFEKFGYDFSKTND